MVLIVVPDVAVDRSILPPKRISVELPNGLYSKMSTTLTTKHYAPTATARPTWRDREAQKQRQDREAILKAAEDARIQSFAKTEENFPSLSKALDKMVVPGGPPGKFAELASKLNATVEVETKEEDIAPTVGIRNASKRYQRTDDDEESYVYVREEEESVDESTPKENFNEKYPPHGKRGTCSPPDHEGWRYVLKKKAKKQKRTLTEAELQKKYREEFFGEGEEGEENVDMNADLTERNQRRDFY